MRVEAPLKVSPDSTTYTSLTKDPINSIVLVFPLFLFYQFGLLLNSNNPAFTVSLGADFLTPLLYRWLGNSPWSYVAFHFALMGLIALFVQQKKRHQPGLPLLFGVILEGALYAYIMGGVIVQILVQMGLQPLGLSLAPMESVILSAGAGIYEEAVFRLFLLGGLLWCFQQMRFPVTVSLFVALIFSSLVFSAFHFHPFGGDSWLLYSFAYRALAGVVFAVLYLTRGFAVAVYTHALYDLFVLLI